MTNEIKLVKSDLMYVIAYLMIGIVITYTFPFIMQIECIDACPNGAIGLGTIVGMILVWPLILAIEIIKAGIILTGQIQGITFKWW